MIAESLYQNPSLTYFTYSKHVLLVALCDVRKGLYQVSDGSHNQMLVLPTVTIHDNGNVLGKPVNRGLNILPCDSRFNWLHEAASLQCSVK